MPRIDPISGNDRNAKNRMVDLSTEGEARTDVAKQKFYIFVGHKLGVIEIEETTAAALGAHKLREMQKKGHIFLDLDLGSENVTLRAHRNLNLNQHQITHIRLLSPKGETQQQETRQVTVKELSEVEHMSLTARVNALAEDLEKQEAKGSPSTTTSQAPTIRGKPTGKTADDEGIDLKGRFSSPSSVYMPVILHIAVAILNQLAAEEKARQQAKREENAKRKEEESAETVAAAIKFQQEKWQQNQDTLKVQGVLNAEETQG